MQRTLTVHPGFTLRTGSGVTGIGRPATTGEVAASRARVKSRCFIRDSFMGCEGVGSPAGRTPRGFGTDRRETGGALFVTVVTAEKGRDLDVLVGRLRRRATEE